LPAPLPELFRAGLQRLPMVRSHSVVLREGGVEKSVVWVNLVRLEGGGMLVSLHNLSAARELEAKTARLQKLATVGTLSAGVAHEIKHALVAIKTYVDWLLEREPGSDSATLVRSEVGRIDSLTSQLLRFAGPARPEMGSVSVHGILRDALKLVRPQLQGRRAEEVVLLEAAQDMVNGDAKQLEQAFLNLILNAVEAIEPGGRVVVRTELVVATEHVSKLEPDRRQPQIQVEIKDTGTGIPESIVGRLFTPFLTTKPGGTGLGLAVTRRIVNEHHGQIAVETKTGAGTTFRILLPLLRP